MSGNFGPQIRKLIYPIQFDADPSQPAVVDRVLQQVRARDSDGSESLRAIREALESHESLSGLIPQPHSEEVIRDYLGEVQKRLQDG